MGLHKNCSSDAVSYQPVGDSASRCGSPDGRPISHDMHEDVYSGYILNEYSCLIHITCLNRREVSSISTHYAMLWIVYDSTNNCKIHSCFFNSFVTRVTHICFNDLTTIGSDNGLSPGQHQAIIWTNAGIFLIGLLGTSFSEILIEIHIFPFKKIHLKMSSEKMPSISSRPQWINSSKPSDVYMHYYTRQILQEIDVTGPVACSVTSHYLKQI